MQLSVETKLGIILNCLLFFYIGYTNYQCSSFLQESYTA